MRKQTKDLKCRCGHGVVTSHRDDGAGACSRCKCKAVVLVKYDVAPLYVARLKRGWTRTDLAKKSGLDQPTITRIENGENQSPKSISKAAKALGVKMEDLL